MTVRGGDRVVAYRLASYESPLRAVPSRRPARFHRETEPEPTHYLCLHPLGPWAELVRARDLREPEALAYVRERTWAVRVDLAGCLRVTLEDAAEHGISPGDLVGDDHEPCRRWAERLRATGVPGAIVPSAALPGTENIVLFGDRVAAPYLAPPLSPVDVPASLTAEGARPLDTLVPLVRLRGEPYVAPDAPPEPVWALAGH